jgi:sugar/nucleoside kinase (ribokinase family)
LNNGQQLAQLFSEVQKTGVITSLDFSLPDPESESGKVNWPEILEKTLPFVDIFVPSLEELLQTMAPGEYAKIQSLPGVAGRVPAELVRDVGQKVIAAGVKILMVKMGVHGVYLFTGDVSAVNKKLGTILEEEKWSNRGIWCSAYQADSSKIKHASGAGDTAIAAFLSAILDGEAPDIAIRYAAIAGRDSLYCEDVFKDMGNWDKLSGGINSEFNEFICD